MMSGMVITHNIVDSENSLDAVVTSFLYRLANSMVFVAVGQAATIRIASLMSSANGKIQNTQAVKIGIKTNLMKET